MTIISPASSEQYRNIKVKIEEYFETDPGLMKAFEDDAETMNLNFSDKDYHPRPSKQNFNR